MDTGTKYSCLAKDFGKFKHSFQLKWLNTFNSMMYSKLKEDFL